MRPILVCRTVLAIALPAAARAASASDARTQRMDVSAAHLTPRTGSFLSSLKKGAAAAALSLGVIGAAMADVVSGTWTFTATGVIGTESTVFRGSFTTSYDSVTGTVDPVVVNYLNLLPGFTGTVGASYFPGSDGLLFGFIPSGGLEPGTNDFRLTFSPSTTDLLPDFIYTRTGTTVIFRAPIETGTFTPAGGGGPTDPPPPPPGGAVPEPNTLLLAGAALLALVASRSIRPIRWRPSSSRWSSRGWQRANR